MSVASYHEEFPNLLAMEKSDRSDLETPEQLQCRLKTFFDGFTQGTVEEKPLHAELFINN